MPRSFDLQGHRGARGLRPENTLPAFEAALDLRVTTLEADLHLTRDGVAVVIHDPALGPPLARRPRAAKAGRPRVSALTLAELRGYVVDGNPDPRRFPDQDRRPTPVAEAFARRQKIEPYAVPTLADMLGFAAAYAGDLGRQAGKTDAQRARAGAVRFSLELKRVPFRPENIGDTYDGSAAGDFERRVVEAVQKAGVARRTVVQSFDHRSVRFARELEPQLQGAALVYNTVLVSLARAAREATAQIYSPDFEFLDRAQVRQAHLAKLRVIPWTVNEADDMARLIDWEVDGIITDFPDRLAKLLQARHIEF